MRVQVVEKILNANDQVAVEPVKLDEKRIFSINLMASPGSVKPA